MTTPSLKIIQHNYINVKTNNIKHNNTLKTYYDNFTDKTIIIDKFVKKILTYFKFEYLNWYLKLIILLLILHRIERINILNITYTKYGDLLPNLKLAEKENKPLNKYGLLRLEYIKSNKKVLYQELLMKDKLK